MKFKVDEKSGRSQGEKLGKISVAKAEGGELLRFCRSLSDVA
jgi:hypothetical protein